MDKNKKSQYGKKKRTRNILIAVLTALVIAAAIFLIVAFGKDSAGMNCFQKNATVATADGEKISMKEYRVSLDTLLRQNFGNYVSYLSQMGYSDEMIRSYQEGAATEALLEKIYVKEAKALGISLTKEEQDECKKTAQDYLAGIEEQYKSYMSENGTYSKTAFEKQIAEYYRELGMNKNEYYAFVRDSEEARLYANKLQAYWNEKNTPDDETILNDYVESAEKSKYQEKEDGTQEAAYQPGQFWKAAESFRSGSDLPMTYLPEGFIFIDFAMMKASTDQEAQELVRQFDEGELKFDDAKANVKNQDPFNGKLNGPYPIAADDHAELFEDQAIYDKAATLEIGEASRYVTRATDADGNPDITVYFFRRAEGSIFMDEASRVIKPEFFVGLSDKLKTQVVNNKWNELTLGWIADIKFEDALYASKGALG